MTNNITNNFYLKVILKTAKNLNLSSKFILLWWTDDQTRVDPAYCLMTGGDEEHFTVCKNKKRSQWKYQYISFWSHMSFNIKSVCSECWGVLKLAFIFSVSSLTCFLTSPGGSLQEHTLVPKNIIVEITCAVKMSNWLGSIEKYLPWKAFVIFWEDKVISISLSQSCFSKQTVLRALQVSLL